MWVVTIVGSGRRQVTSVVSATTEVITSIQKRIIEEQQNNT